jgi:hypothetical protein
VIVDAPSPVDAPADITDTETPAADVIVDAPSPVDAPADITDTEPPAAAAHAADAASDMLSQARSSLIEVYTGLLGRIRALAGDPSQNELVTRLVDTAARLVDSRFARRLVFGD